MKPPTIPDREPWLHRRPVSGLAVALAKHQEGPKAAARKRPQISPGQTPPLRTALARPAQYPKPKDQIRRQGFTPALVRKQSRSIGGRLDYSKLAGQPKPRSK